MVLIPAAARPQPRDHFQIEACDPKPSFSFILVLFHGTSGTMKWYQNTPEKNRGASSSSKRTWPGTPFAIKKDRAGFGGLPRFKKIAESVGRSVEAFQSVPLVAARTTAGATTVLSLADREPTQLCALPHRLRLWAHGYRPARASGECLPPLPCAFSVRGHTRPPHACRRPPSL